MADDHSETSNLKKTSGTFSFFVVHAHVCMCVHMCFVSLYWGPKIMLAQGPYHTVLLMYRTISKSLLGRFSWGCGHHVSLGRKPPFVPGSYTWTCPLSYFKSLWSMRVMYPHLFLGHPDVRLCGYSGSFQGQAYQTVSSCWPPRRNTDSQKAWEWINTIFVG